jgi:hypothetical protein
MRIFARKYQANARDCINLIKEKRKEAREERLRKKEEEARETMRIWKEEGRSKGGL